MSSLKLTADSGGGTVELKAPATTTSNAAKVVTLSQNPGMITQVVQAAKTDTASHDTNTWTDISGLSVSITPAATSSKILITGTCYGSTLNLGYIRIMRGSTEIGSGTAAGSRVPCHISFHASGDGNRAEMMALNYLDSPSTTSATTYKLQWRDESGTIYLNRSAADADNAAGGRGVSTITAMEVAG